jgi:osmotically-inducible protein OsmY
MRRSRRESRQRSHGATITLRGVVRSVDEHDRAITLARETAGVTHVVDELRMEAR